MGAISYDFRARFGLSLDAVFAGDVSWDEAWQLTSGLLADPTSRTCAAVAGWEHPATHEFRVLADLYDATVAIAAGKKNRSRLKPYPRPWSDRDAPKRSRTDVPQDVIRAALAKRGHHI